MMAVTSFSRGQKNLGDRGDFWQLWLLYQEYLYRRCVSWMGGNYTDAEEALSRAMFKAWNKFPDYAAKITNPKAWLIRMTHNLCVDIHRERQRQAISLENIEPVPEKKDEIFLGTVKSPESLILQGEMKEHIRRAVGNLPPRLREAFVLRFYQEMSYPEISQRLAISQSNARKRIQQARESLQRQLRQYL